MKTKAIKLSVLLVLSLLAILPSACKKESNDPDIDDRVVNKTITAVVSGVSFYAVDSIDIDLDGISDLAIIIDGTDSVQTVIADARNMAILVDSLRIGASLIPLWNPINAGVAIDSNSIIWYGSSGSYLSAKSIRVSNSVDFGIHGAGDKYFGVLLRKSLGNYLYGWLKVNLSNDFKTFTIKELAVQKVINKPIKIGEK